LSDFDEMGEIQGLQSLEIKRVASFEFETTLSFMVSQQSNMSNNNLKQQDTI
jgi:hypothetical protein